MSAITTAPKRCLDYIISRLCDPEQTGHYFLIYSLILYYFPGIVSYDFTFRTVLYDLAFQTFIMLCVISICQLIAYSLRFRGHSSGQLLLELSSSETVDRDQEDPRSGLEMYAMGNAENTIHPSPSP